MDDLDTLLGGVRLDTRGFAADVSAMRSVLEGGLGAGADTAGRSIETSLLRAVRIGKLGFDDLKTAAVRSLDAIAAAGLKSGLAALIGSKSGGLAETLASVVSGLPGRATGGPVTAGRPYLIGERGPELFVPNGAGRIEVGAAGGERDVRVSITVNAGAGESGEALRQSSRQVARAVRAALAE
ncbi:tail tape measure protein [Sphingomonas sp.]|uniref:tail tape measure protein n=1 Tax=Sphingomonas sp. TaxID=28214 RepID=UPI003CC5297F